MTEISFSDRYSRQAILKAIGAEGQRRIESSFAVVVGCGALGSIISTTLVRAGVGRVRIIDRDFIEVHNLQRQVLFDEEDIGAQLPKAVAAERHLRKVNSQVKVEGIVEDLNFTNVERLLAGADVVLDGLDNFETRFLINDASLKLGIPWIYGGAISTCGMTMTIIPGETPCLRCFSIGPPVSGSLPTCETAGVLGPAPFIIGALQAAEALKLLVGARDAISRDLIVVDVWGASFERIKVGRNEKCPACAGIYEFLQGSLGTRTSVLCGQNAVQVLNPGSKGVSLEELAARLTPLGRVDFNEFMLRFAVGDEEIIVFRDGRAIVKNTSDEGVARSLYAKYVGM